MVEERDSGKRGPFQASGIRRSLSDEDVNGITMLGSRAIKTLDLWRHRNQERDEYVLGTVEAEWDIMDREYDERREGWRYAGDEWVFGAQLHFTLS